MRPLDRFAQRAKALLRAIAPIVSPGQHLDPDHPDAARELVFSGLVSLLHACHASEIDFDRELNDARDLVADDLRIDDQCDGDPRWRLNDNA